MIDVYPTCLEGAEKRLEENDPKEAAALCRRCLESLLKDIVLIKDIKINTRRVRFKILNQELLNEGVYDKYWHDEIKNLVINIGNPAVHNEREILFEEANRFISRIREFINVVYLPLIEDGKPDFLEKYDFQLVLEYLNNFRVINEKEHIFSLSTGRKVDYTQLKVEYKDNSGQAKWEDATKWWIESKKPVLILAEPGQGKSTLVKELFKQIKRKFLSKKSKCIPIICKLSDFTSFESGIKWLSTSTYNCLKKTFLQKKIDEGKISVFADGWDELSPKYRTEAERFLSEVSRKNNLITVTSRFIDHFPTLKLFLLDKEQEIKLQTCEIRPLDYHQIIEFIKNRNPDLNDIRLKSFQKSFWLSDLKPIPLWLDLLASIPVFDPENELIELDLLTHWVNQVRLRDEFVYKEINEVERLAYLAIRPPSRPKITKNYIKEKINLSTQAFEGLFSIGWLVPSGYEKVEPKYDFVHFRLHEFIASRYLSKNWQELEGDLFEREEGLLSQEGKEVLIEYALLDQKYRNTPQHILAERVFTIAGEPGWEQGEIVDYEKLRDPFLAGYLFEILNLPEESFSWITNLDCFFNDLFNLLNNREKRKLIFSYLKPLYTVRSLLCRIPLVVLFDNDYGESVRAMVYDTKLHVRIIDKLLNILNDPQILENSEYERLFFEILEKRPSLGQWKDFLINFVKDKVGKGGDGFYRAFSMLDNEIKQNLLLSWAFHPDPEVRIYPSCRNNIWIEQIHDQNKIADIFEHWLEDDVSEIRNEAFQILIYWPEWWNESIINKMIVNVPSEMEKQRLMGVILNHPSLVKSDIVSNYFFSLPERFKKSFLHDQRFLKIICLPNYTFLLTWFMNNAPLWLIVDFLYYFYDRNKSTNLITQINVSNDTEEIRECINRLPFTDIKGVEIARSLFSKHSQILKIFLLKNEIFNRFLKNNPSVTLTELSLILKDQIDFIHHLKDGLPKIEWIDDIDGKIYSFFNKIESPSKLLIHALLIPTHLEWKWINIPILFDWFEKIVEIDDNAILERYSKFLLKNSQYIKNNKSIQQNIHQYISHKQPEKLKWVFIICSLLVESFNGEELKEKALNSMIQHNDVLIRAIGLRIFAEKSGVNIKRVMNKASASLKKGFIRPIITERIVIELDKKGIIGVSEITEGGVKSPSLINFGLLRTQDLEIIPDYKSLAYPLQVGEFLVPSHTKSFFTFTNYRDSERKNIFTKWIFDDTLIKTPHSMEVPDLSWIKNGLNDTCDELKIATLFYIEDLIFEGRISDKDKEILRDLKRLYSSENELVSSFSIYLRLILVSTKEKTLIINDIALTNLNLQAILWALGTNTNDDLDRSVLQFIQKFDENLLLKSIDILNPWIIFYPTLFRYFWDLILKLDKKRILSHFFINEEPNLFYYLMQNTILVDQHLTMMFLTEKDLQHYEGVDTWFKYLNSKIHFSRKEIIELISRLENHEENSLRLFGNYLKIALKLDYQALNQIISLDKPEYTDLRFLLMFYEQLDKFQLKKLYELIFNSSYKDLKHQATEIICFCSINEDIIPLLNLTLNWIKTNQDNALILQYSQNFFLFLNKCEAILFKNYFEKVISELGSNIRYLVSEATKKDVLYRLLNYFDTYESEENTRMYWYIYRLLFLKVWYSYKKFWSEIMNET